MSNLPITTNAPQTAAKPAQAAAQTEDSAAQGQPFGDVLARQVSDATAADGTSLPKKKSVQSAADVLDKIKMDDATLALTGEAAGNLPADMLAALIPQGIAIATQPATAAEETDLPRQAATAAEETGLPGQAAIATGLLTQAAGAASASSDTAGLPKQAALASTLAKIDLGANQGGVPAPAAKGTGVARDALIESKKDAAFTSMLATMNATMPNKLADTDVTTAAAPQPNAAALAAMQASAAPLPPAIVVPTVLTINTPVTHDKWGDEFNQKITWLANAKEQSAELHLNPPQLGPMDVVLKINGDQATALFTSPHAAVREAIEQALPKLREMMADSGIMLGNASVSDHASRNRQNESDSRSSNSRSGVNGIADSAAASNLSMRVSPISRHNGIVDTFA